MNPTSQKKIFVKAPRPQVIDPKTKLNNVALKVLAESQHNASHHRKKNRNEKLRPATTLQNKKTPIKPVVNEIKPKKPSPPSIYEYKFPTEKPQPQNEDTVNWMLDQYWEMIRRDNPTKKFHYTSLSANRRD